MATDATGSPTPLGIPKYNTSADAPSGLGFNAAMDSIDALIAARVKVVSPADNDVPVWDSASGTWKPSSSSLAKKLPGTELTYNEFTSNVSVTATSEATANTVVTASAFSFDGATSVVIEFYSTGIKRGTTAINVWLYDGSSSIGEIAYSDATVGAAGHTVLGRRRLTPSNASHTYSIRAHVDAGTGTVAAAAGGAGLAMPGYIRIVKA